MFFSWIADAFESATKSVISGVYTAVSEVAGFAGDVIVGTLDVVVDCVDAVF